MTTKLLLRGARRILLAPITAVYALIIYTRHFAYDIGWMKSRKACIPTLVLGNIHAGGTGKTPHASYFLRAISEKLGGTEHVALLSRGFKRRSKGFKWVEQGGDWRDFGDEPALLKSFHPKALIAVCENRLEGIARIKRDMPLVKVVILDDGLQHRSLIPHKSVVILDADRPLKEAALLPAGELRDLKNRLSKFDACIISRATLDREIEYERQGLEGLNKPIFLSQMRDGSPISTLQKNSEKPRILAISGIAEPERFMDSLAHNWSVVRRETYSDHHEYSEKDIRGWLMSIRNEKLDAIVTTSKDAVRIRSLILKYPEIVLVSICIEVEWRDEEAINSWVDEWLQSPIFAKHK
jgi:tetraacyldisaccharide 4'-kinase